MDLLVIVLKDAFWSALAATGFAILFNVPRRTLWGCALAGATGHAIRTLLIEVWDAPIELGTLIGATILGFIGVWLARHYRAPSLIFSVTGAIPMVPGFYAYSAMLGLIELTNPNVEQQVLLDTAANAIRTGLILSMLALGITLPRLLFHRPRPVV